MLNRPSSIYFLILIRILSLLGECPLLQPYLPVLFGDGDSDF